VRAQQVLDAPLGVQNGRRGAFGVGEFGVDVGEGLDEGSCAGAGGQDTGLEISERGDGEFEVVPLFEFLTSAWKRAWDPPGQSGVALRGDGGDVLDLDLRGE
jgi:hypothetical protein